MALNTESTYTFILGGPAVTDRGTSTSCQLQIRHPDYPTPSPNEFISIFPVNAAFPSGLTVQTSIINAFLSPGQSFTGQQLIDAFQDATSEQPSPEIELTDSNAFRFSVGAGGDCQPAFTDFFLVSNL